MTGAWIPAAAPSPRISGGTIKWYAGDTFTLNLQLALTDQDGAAVGIPMGDVVSVTFYDRCLRPVYSFADRRVTDNVLSLVFTEEVSSRFPAGEYTYDVRWDGDRRVTVARGNHVLVE